VFGNWQVEANFIFEILNVFLIFAMAQQLNILCAMPLRGI
jgi:hypothetical protein